jgi:hypothetical protein
VIIAILVAAPAVASTGTVSPTAPTDELPPEPAFVVALDADGSAQVTLVITFDLTTDSEQEAFESLRANTTSREQRTDRFAAQMQAIAARAENTTGRPMEVRDPAITFTTKNDTGVVGLSVRWTDLATQEDDRLVLREPFASGFDVDRRFQVVGPDGYGLAAVTPSPTTRTKNSATWAAERDFEGFEATFASEWDETTGDRQERTAGTSDDGGSSAGAPGFGIEVAALAVLSTTLLLYWRGDQR